MKEADYIKASELARLRCAFNILRDVIAANVGEVTGVKVGQAEDEKAEIMQRLDVWIARLERSLHRRGTPDKEPWRRQWPGKVQG